MKSNEFDKILKDKLQSADYPFDPDAWSQMESMLDHRDRRRAAWWWWPLGIAAVAISITGLYALSLTFSDSPLAPALTASHAASHTTHTSINSASPSKSFSTESYKSSAASESHHPDPSPSYSKSAVNHTVAITNNKHSSTIHTHTFTPISSSTSSALSASYNLESASNNIASPTKLTDVSIKSIISQIDQPSFPLDNILVLTLAQLDRSDDGDISQKTFRHSKKHLIHYAFGLTSQLTEAYARSTWASTPSWGIGFSHELGIGTRFAFTNSVLYVQSSFAIQHPEYPASIPLYPTSYRAVLRQIDIPVGIKVYPLSHKHFRLSIGASYVQHIKLSEEIDYILSASKSVQTVSPETFNDLYPSNINFGGSTAIPSQSLANNYDQNLQRPNYLSGSYYSIAQAKRYYGSMQFTLAADFIFRKHIVLSAEPLFQMSLSKIGAQNARKYDAGLKLSLKYGF